MLCEMHLRRGDCYGWRLNLRAFTGFACLYALKGFLLKKTSIMYEGRPLCVMTVVVVDVVWKKVKTPKALSFTISLNLVLNRG